MPRKDRPKILLFRESKLPEWLARYTNTIVITITWPCFILGIVYLAAFFVLNSSYGPKILHSQLSGFLQLERQEKRTYAGIAVMAALNAACNFLFISVFRWGLFGLGLATSISTWAFLLIQLSYYMTGRSAIRFRLIHYLMMKRKVCGCFQDTWME